MEFSLGPFQPVADRVYVAVAEPASVNVGLVVGTTGAMLVDTGSSPGQGRAIRDAAQAVAGDVPLTHVAVTHAHYDHLYGLAAFRDLESIAHDGLVDLLRTRRPDAEELARFGMTDADLVEPTRTFGMVSAVNLGDCHAELVHFGRGHTDHDLVVVIPERGVSFHGDLLESADPPAAGPDSWPADWAPTLDWVAGALPRPCRIVPGHGPVFTPDAAVAQRDEIQWLADRAVELYDAARSPQGAWTRGEWPWTQEYAEAFVAQGIRRLEDAGRPRKRRQLPVIGG